MANLNNTVGTVFIGSLLSMLLFGVTITQTINYFQSGHNDGWFVVFVVFLSLLLDILHAALGTHGTYLYVVGSIGNPENLILIPWSFVALIIVTSFTVAVVRLLFVRRIWYLSNKNYFVTGIQVLFGVAALAVGICAGVRAFSLSTFQNVDDTPWLIYTTTGCDLLSDTCIACTLYYYLYRGSTGFKGTSKLLHKIALYVVGTGVLTVIWDILEIVTYKTSNTLLFGVFYISLSKLYTNALLASLNARPMIQRKMEHSVSYLKSFGSEGTRQGSKDARDRIVRNDVELQSTVITLGMNSHSESGTLTIDETATQSSEKVMQL
ncbi:hypothetical protein SCHPADRAFT_439919 [Schizopora paradoxa]|uniref:DUF6534 domain-containing protein n=1 Tax=Schizopora paradoxa TaxID=27342 RepID=A0A0H2S571_9AGAM|nr:hypothetical protein SCHPADRAFT_439919 [Schizopora paradoxa]